MGKIKHFGTGVGLACGVTVFVLCSLASLSIFNPFIYFIWVAFIPLMIYFAYGKHKDFKLYASMFLSFLCGLGWGWISNVINYVWGTSNPLLCSLLANGVLMALLLWAHLALFQGTLLNNPSMAFFGYALTCGFFGRPNPFVGAGVVGPMPWWMITILQVAYVIFGLLITFGIEVLGDVFNGWILKPKGASNEKKQVLAVSKYDYTKLEKCDEIRDFHVDYYRKSPAVFVVLAKLRDYAHNLAVEIEVDMEKDVIVDVNTMFTDYPEKKCLMIAETAKGLIGKPVMYHADEMVNSVLGGKCGCETVHDLVWEGVSALPFIYNICRLKDGSLSFDEFGKLLPVIRKDTCIAFNPEAVYTGPEVEGFKGRRDEFNAGEGDYKW